MSINMKSKSYPNDRQRKIAWVINCWKDKREKELKREKLNKKISNELK